MSKTDTSSLVSPTKKCQLKALKTKNSSEMRRQGFQRCQSCMQKTALEIRLGILKVKGGDSGIYRETQI